MTSAATPVGQSVLSFAYQAQSLTGQPISGTIDAAALDEANQKLQSLGLRILSIEPLHATARLRPLSDGDFLAFNEQLAQLTGAGLPVEQGLKLIAKDLHRGRLATAVAAISDELEKGVPLADALSHHQGQFPPLYGRIVEAGIRSNNLSALLLNLGTHLETVRRLRASLWRATAYPIMVLFALMIVLFFISQAVIPQFQAMYDSFKDDHSVHYGWFASRWNGAPPSTDPRPALPWITDLVFAVGKAMPIIFCASIVLFLLLPYLLRSMSKQSSAVERLSLRTPLIGPILRGSLLARWCDAAHLAVVAGMDLPGAIRLASEAVASPSLMLDGCDLAHDLEAGRPFAMDARRAILPATIPTAIELASRSQNLPAALQSLSDLYRRQADSRLENLPTILTPILLTLLAVVVGMVIAGLLLPMMQLIQWVTGGFH
jgi:type IV pilus assembly protein PilC